MTEITERGPFLGGNGDYDPGDPPQAHSTLDPDQYYVLVERGDRIIAAQAKQVAELRRLASFLHSCVLAGEELNANDEAWFEQALVATPASSRFLDLDLDAPENDGVLAHALSGLSFDYNGTTVYLALYIPGSPDAIVSAEMGYWFRLARALIARLKEDRHEPGDTR